MRFNRFEEIQAWQKAKELCISIYAVFGESRDFGFRDQIQRAAVSVMNNIAEGFERRSNNEFRHFLYVAKGSCGEVRSMLILAAELNKLPSAKSLVLQNNAEEISRMIAGLIKKL